MRDIKFLCGLRILRWGVRLILPVTCLLKSGKRETRSVLAARSVGNGVSETTYGYNISKCLSIESSLGYQRHGMYILCCFWQVISAASAHRQLSHRLIVLCIAFCFSL